MYNDVKIEIINNIIIINGGYNSDDPQQYMDDVVKYILKLLGNPKYNDFIENYLDNPWVRILIFDFNSFKFENKFTDIIKINKKYET